MKHQAILATFCAILSVVGCERKATQATVGPFDLKNDTATGQAFCIEFNVAGATGAEIASDLSGSSATPSQAEITLADDLKIKLQTKPESELVTFGLNGKSFGDLNAGDKVEIAKDRSVRVNGENRTTAESTPE